MAAPAATTRSTGDEGGWTLVELMIVLAILGALLAIAIPSYLGYRDRGVRTTAQANLREALPDVESYYVDNKTYIGLTVAVLRAQYDQGISPDVHINDPSDMTDDHYCLKSTDRGTTYWLRGPGGEITSTKPSGCT